MNEKFSDIEVIAFLDESLNPQRSAQLEFALRTDDQLRRRVLEKLGQQSAGLHTIGGIWQRSKATCPSRQELQAFLQETIEGQAADYIRFHLIQIGCRYCHANCADLLAETDGKLEARSRRQRVFQTSAGYLRSVTTKD